MRRRPSGLYVPEPPRVATLEEVERYGWDPARLRRAGLKPPIAGGAVTIVQSKTGSGTGVTNHTAAFTSATTTGNTIVMAATLGIRSGGATSMSLTCSDGGTNTYTRWVASSSTQSTTTDYSCILSEIWYCENITGHAAPTITVGAGVATDGGTTIWELSPCTHDQASTGTATSGTAASSSSLTPSAAGAAVLAAVFGDDGLGSTGPTAGTNFTIDLTSGGASEEVGSEHWVQGAAAATTGAFTLHGSSKWNATQGIFIPSGGSSPGFEFGVTPDQWVSSYGNMPKGV